MGMTVMLESEPELSIPSEFPDTDSKGFLGTMFGPLVEVLERHSKLDLNPLKHCAVFVDDEAEEELGAEWAEEARRNSELAWHSPDEFIACLEQLAAWLDQAGRKLPRAVLRETSRHYQEYYQNGDFYSDVAGCLAAVWWAKEHGAQRLRFFAY